MSWPPFHTLFVIVVTSVAANHQGANCDCESQGPWQPLFKPSQILHSEFPEHQHSSSTGGPKPSKYRHYKIVPHIVVPLVNPVALTIHHQNDNHIDNDEPYKYKTKGNYNKNIKEVHYHYNFPDPNVSKYNSPSSTPTPPDDSYVNNNHQEDHRNEETYPEEEANHDQHSYNENSHHSHEEEESYNYGENQSGEGSSGHSYDPPTHDPQHDYQPEEKPTYNPPYYGSGEQNDAVYDASKLVPGYELKPADYPVFQNTQQGSQKHLDHFHPNKIETRGKTRGKSMYIPVYRISQPSINHLPPSLPFKVQDTTTEKPIQSPTGPPSFHPTQHNLPMDFFKNHFQRHRMPLHPFPLPQPPFSVYNPWRFLMKDEGRRMILMRPPAPGLPDTWTTTSGSHENHAPIIPPKLKMTGVIYPIKNFQV